MSIDKIETPRGRIIKTEAGTAELIWNPNFERKWTGQYSRAQMWLDQSVLSLCEPYIPIQSSMLRQSGTLGTEVGSGEVCWIAPYARKQYYSTADTRSYDALCGGHWFERMKADRGAQLIAGVKKIAGGNR